MGQSSPETPDGSMTDGEPDTPDAGTDGGDIPAADGDDIPAADGGITEDGMAVDGAAAVIGGTGY